MLLLENNFDADPWPKSDRTALQLALFPESPKKECDDSMELAKLLCSKGVDPNLVAQKDRLTPLQQAIEHGNLEIVELLFEHHANVNKHSEPDVEFDLSATHQPNEESLMTPLQLAIKEQHPAIIKTLLKHGADVNLRAKRCGPPGGHKPSILYPFLTPLQLALYTSQPEYVEMILEHGANINAPPHPQGGATVLQYAAMRGYVGLAEALLEKGAKVNAAASEYDGRTALEGAGEYGRLDMVQLLLNAGARVDGFDLERALDRAEGNGHIALKEYLERRCIGV
ncbi:uncharacterized protein PODANS_7_2960 [Podospora anserina S mat+]|uniref:Podospora anserina S mat+ genomic DNA chromosome 7, supercontig 1 n=1 Tax=Podospora anserina (strain S / ATCC MYA-4624 / DSM 980 / FGSC 10383) TaxID=515849 RepID=B2AVH2_PODAN|nr:uncharacterized protein PODANS_7_2960 [Podospora anserina S mat+]CAP68396.1 unnamed protein product [Podospora anserina S mat+]CDP31868.1 Putative protein of unknown function [Podospora anserina S mat+]